MAILTVCLVAAASWSRPALVVSHATPHLTSHSRSIRACAVPMPAMPISEPADVPQPANDVPPEPEPLQDALAGITVGFSLLSKAIAASAIAGVDPLVGLWSSVVMGVTAPILGSRPGVISGAAAVVVVPLGVMVAQHGTAYIPLTILACAIFEGLFGFFRLARLTSIISDAVLSGFLNGLGLLLFMSQVKVFKYAPAFIPAVGVAAICAAVTELLPRVTTAVPSSLAGLAAATAVGLLSHQPLTTLASTADPSTFAGGLSSLPKLVDFGELGHLATSVPALKIVLPVALSIAFISLLETLLAAKVVDDLKCESLCIFKDPDEEGGEEISVGDQSVIAMSIGNGISALLGGFGGCGLIPQTVLNLKSGGGGPLSSIVYAVSMAMFVLVLAPLVGQVSQAALGGLMLTVAYATVQWGASWGTLMRALGRSGAEPPSNGSPERSAPLIELTALVLTTYLCYAVDMASGIVFGVLIERALNAGRGLWQKLRPAPA